MSTTFADLPALYRQPGLLIGGRWRAATGSASHGIVDPATGRVLTSYAVASAADLDEALASAAAGLRTWRATSAFERAGVLRRAAQLMRERGEFIAQLLTLEEGKPLVEARGELAVTAEMFEWAADEGRRAYGRTIPARSAHLKQRVEHQPIGVVAAFAAWNFPARNPGYKIAAALAAGCACIVKPAEETPLTCIALAEALRDAGLPADVLNVVYGNAPTLSEHLIASPAVRKISFTGSTRVGALLARLAAAGAKPATLELGGQAPVIVFEDADLEAAAKALVAAKFRNAGQTCISPTRFFVHASRVDAFLDHFTAAAGALEVGQGLSERTTMGPLAQDRRVPQTEGFVADATDHGARVVLGGKRLGSEGYFWAPTVLRDVPDSARIMSEEPFGPIAAVTPFDSFDEVIERANSVPYGLAAYAFTRSLRTAEDVADALEAGMVGINTCKIAYAETPFGGVKESGYGSEGGVEGLAPYLVTKSVSVAY